jgi:hypothetical protein
MDFGDHLVSTNRLGFSGNEIKCRSFVHRTHALFAEEVGDVFDVHTEEFETSWVVVLDGLGNIDDKKLFVVVTEVRLRSQGSIQKIEFAQVGMD